MTYVAEPVGSHSIDDPAPAPAPTVSPADVQWLVVAVDGSWLGDIGADVAARLAARLDAGLHLFTAARPRDVDRCAHHLSALARRYPLRVEMATEESEDPVAAIAGAADRERTTVCMASHGRGRTEALRGSVAGAVLRRLRTPIVLAGPEADPEQVSAGARVVAGVDGTPAAEATLEPALAWAARLRLRVDVVTVAEPALALETRSAGPTKPRARRPRGICDWAGRGPRRRRCRGARQGGL